MPQFVDHVQLNKNELRGATLQPLGTAPSSPATGQMYYDSTGGVLRPLWWNGSAWTNDATLLGGQAGSYYLARANHTGTQSADTITDGTTNKAYTATEKTKLAGIATGATANSSDATLLARANHTGTQLAATISDLATTVQAYRLDQFAAPTASVSLNSQKITNLATPTAVGDAATKGYVDSVAQGLDVKASVRVASTAAVTVTYNATNGTSGRGQITAAPNTLDGVSLAAGDRILLKNQATAAQNGIWVVTTLGTGANGVWDRAADFDSDAEVTAGAFAFVEEGTANGDTSWLLTTNNPITIGGGSGTSLTFTQFGSATSYTAGNGLTLTGNTLDVVAGTGITVAADSVSVDTSVVARKGSSLLAGASTSYTIAHGLGTANLVVSVMVVSSGEIVYPTVVVDATNITITFSTAQTTNTLRATWVG